MRVNEETYRKMPASLRAMFAKCPNDSRDEVVEGFPETASGKPCGKRNIAGLFVAHEHGTDLTGYGDSGSAARFFYSAKASAAERGGSKHPTVKPLALMRYLVRLCRPPHGGIVLDPFLGSGTTGEACVLEGREFVGIERDKDYLDDAAIRIGAIVDFGEPPPERKRDSEATPQDRQGTLFD